MNDIELFAENELTVAENDERAFHEKVVDDVKDGIEKLAGIGDASLKVLRDKRLYRSTHKTFEEYCQARFGFDRRYVNRQIFHGAMQELLGPNGPKKEAQSRPLASLPNPELQAQAWELAQQTSQKNQPSNREVAEAVAKVQAELDAATQRCEEFRQESNERRKTIRELETQIDLLKAQPTPEPEKIIVAPDDYEIAKAKAAQLETELANLKKEQATLINNQVKAKLHERQAELDKLEQDKQLLDEVVSRKKAYLASIDSDIKRIETHQKVIEENRLHLISLAAFLSDEEPVQDADTRKRWNALADMLAEAMTAVRQYAGDARPALSVVNG